MKPEIDFVVPWVDGSDPDWQRQRALYNKDEDDTFIIQNEAARWRDWGILPYWFRAVEKYAPWVRKIHFITCGQVPEWLNLNHPKLHFVRHEDYIPHQWLPTFSANPIELNIFRIDGLAEKFVYLNDDVFLNAQVKPEDFFVDGLPCICAGFHPGPSGVTTDGIGNMVVNDLIIIARNFDFRSSFKANITKWLRLRYGRVLLKTLYMLPAWWAGKTCRGFHCSHTAASYLKSTFVEVWEKEKKYLEHVCKNRFRTKDDVNQYLMEYWQIMSGKFYPRSVNFSALYHTKRMSPECKKLIDDILHSRHKVICINDGVDDQGFEKMSKTIQEVYSKVLPEKSAFER